MKTNKELAKELLVELRLVAPYMRFSCVTHQDHFRILHWLPGRKTMGIHYDIPHGSDFPGAPTATSNAENIVYLIEENLAFEYYGELKTTMGFAYMTSSDVTLAVKIIRFRPQRALADGEISRLRSVWDWLAGRAVFYFVAVAMRLNVRRITRIWDPWDQYT